MGFNIKLLWEAPEINPVNNKARSIPVLNPFNLYGRVFFFSWFGFLIAFWSWYAFPPLLKDVIADDIDLSTSQLGNSNIISLLATLLVRLVSGPSCDRFGPRLTFAGLLLIGSIPTFCAGGVTNPAGLMALRFFVGILGGTFVPCQVWTTGFFDKNVVGTANALTGGWGNAGGGITYFVMPAVFNSLVQQSGLTPHVAWRVTFVVPGILIVFTAVMMLLFTSDTPTGKWSDRETAVNENLRRHSMVGVVDVPGQISEQKPVDSDASPAGSRSENSDKKDIGPGNPDFSDNEAHLTPDQMLDTAKGEVVRKPTFREALFVFTSPQSFVTASAYFCSFGGELAINSILGNYYSKNFPNLTLQESGNWAAMFGLLNVAFRPLGGVVSDLVYRATGGSLWAKKALLHGCGLITGMFLIIIGQLDPKDQSTMFGLIAGMAFFLEAGNGLNYALVPHVHPFANGIISGLTGASGNFGGIIFAIIFRYEGSNYGKTFWIAGIIHMLLNLSVSWIPPIPKNQVGGR